MFAKFSLSPSLSSECLLGKHGREIVIFWGEVQLSAHMSAIENLSLIFLHYRTWYILKRRGDFKIR